METMQAIAKRKSVRAYRQVQIPNGALNAILAAGCAAPVASGAYDSLHITVVQDRALLDKISGGISEMMNRKNAMAFGAPTIVFVSSTEPHFPGIDFANAACVLENMVLAATDQNVDSILYGAAAVAVRTDDKLRKALAIPEGFHPTLCAALGYAAVPDEPAKAHTISMNRV